MKKIAFILIAAMAVLASCTQQKASFPVYVWQGIGEKTDFDKLREDFRFWKSQGVVGVCLENSDPEIVAKASALAHAEGLEYHAWIPCMLRGGKPQHWYAVNRLGQRADEYPAYVSYYKAMDPRNPEVRAYLVEQLSAIADIPTVDYVQLDYIRYPDVILSRGLWDKYGLVMDEEYPPADYCYCDDCVAAFKEQSGIDIRAVEDPSKVAEWAQFRCDAVTGLVNEIAAAIHAKGKKVSADVFPGPDSHARWMVRQEWNQWNVDMFFPMNYNDFYLQPAEWVGTVTAEEVAAAGDIPVVSGLFICREWKRKVELEDPEESGLIPAEIGTAVAGAREAGAVGICLFTPGSMTPEHWSALQEALNAVAAGGPKAAEIPSARIYEAPRASGPLVIDGILDEPDWQRAPLSEPFADIRGVDFEPAPVKQTYMKMLWDSENLYIAGILEEDNITASLTEHDAIIYHDNDWEVFIDPDADCRMYFEIELNAFNTVMDLLMDRPYRDGGKFYLPWDVRGLKTAVHIDGTLNDPSDTDKGWTVEMAIPIASLCVEFQKPEELLQKEWKIGFSRVEWLKAGGPEENWVWNPTGIVDMHQPEKWGVLHFAE